jgi:ketosteroid isomerase-like protein
MFSSSGNQPPRREPQKCRKREVRDLSEEVRKAIGEGNVKFGKYVREGDAGAIAALYTMDAYLLPPNSGTIQGRKSIEGFWGGAISGLGLKDAILTTVELHGTGDIVTEVGEYLLKIQPKGKKEMEDKGKYVVAWKHTAEGWKLHRDIWNTSLPAQQ